MANTTSQDLFNKIKGQFGNLTLGREDGAQTLMPREAVFFEFDYTSKGKKLGSVVVSLVDEGTLKVYFNDDIVTEEDEEREFGFGTGSSTTWVTQTNYKKICLSI